MNSKVKSKSKTKTKEKSHSKSKKKAPSSKKSSVEKRLKESTKSSSKRSANFQQQSSSQVKSGRGRDRMLSPKTISFKKIMEKYGEVDSEGEKEKSRNSSPDEPLNFFQFDNNLKKRQVSNERNTNRTNEGSNHVHTSPDNNLRISNLSQVRAQGITQPLLHQTYSQLDEIKLKNILSDYERLKEERKNYEKQKIKLAQLEEKLTGGNIVNYEEIVKLKEKIDNVEKTNENLKHSKQEYIDTTQKKVSLLIRLCQKHLNKIVNITNLQAKFRSSSESNDIMLNELRAAVEKFSNTLSNQNLISSIFDGYHLRDEYLEDDSFSRTGNTAMIEMIQKLENQIKSLTEKNESLSKNKKFESENIEELRRIKKSYSEIKTSYEEGQKTILMQKQLIKDLESKAKILEEEVKNNHSKFNSFKDKNQKYKLLKEKVIKYKNELKYKESIIEYLEKANKVGKQEFESTGHRGSDHAFSKSKQTSSLSRGSHTPEENKNFISSQRNKYKRTDEGQFPSDAKAISENSLEMNNRNRVDKNEDMKIQPSNSKQQIQQMDSEEEFEKHLDNKNHNDNFGDDGEGMQENSFKGNIISNKYYETENDLENREFYTNSDMNNSKSVILKKEINNLDQEIRNLQGKLRSMIDVKK